MKRITTIALHSVFLVALVFSTGYTLAQKETQEKQQTEKKQVPTQSVPRPLLNKQRDRIVIAPVTISIPDESALISVLRPFSTPPDPLSIVFEDGRVILVRGIDWQTAPASGTANRPPKGIKWCDCGGNLGRHMCPESWSCADCCEVIKKAFEARTLLPHGRDYGPVLIFDAKQKQGRFLDPTERMFKEELSKIDGILSQAGLQRVSGRKKSYPIELVLLGAEPHPEQTITCMAKDAQGNCTHWRICGTTVSGVYKCYDVVKDPLLGWVVTW